MSLAKTRRRELLTNELKGEDFHEIDTVSDIELESYALSSIIIEKLWPFQKAFLEENPLPLVTLSESFWEELHQAFLNTSKVFSTRRLDWIGEQLHAHDDQSLERRALMRYLMLRRRMGSLGLPSIDDVYYTVIQMTRVAIAIDPKQAATASVHKPMAYLMAQSRPFSRWILRAISQDPKGPEQSLANPFLPSSFRLHEGALEFDPESRAYFEEIAPVFAKKYEQVSGNALRTLQCPVLYANPQIFSDITHWVVAEIRRQYFDRLLV